MERREEEETRTAAQSDEEEERKSEAQSEEEEEDKRKSEAQSEDDEEEDKGEAAAGKDEIAAGVKKKKTKEKGGAVTSCSDRKCVPGIIYLGHIPPRLRPKNMRNLLSVYGEIGRVFLQPEGNIHSSLSSSPSVRFYLLITAVLIPQMARSGQGRRGLVFGGVILQRGGWSSEINVWRREWRLLSTTPQWRQGNANDLPPTSGASRYVQKTDMK